MSQQIWCERCATEEHKQSGERIIFAGFTPEEIEAKGYDQPPEYERVVFGVLKLRPAWDRHVRYGSPGHLESHEIPADEYLCDNCNGEMKVGTRVCAWTVFSKDMPEPVGWETNWITPEPVEVG